MAVRAEFGEQRFPWIVRNPRIVGGEPTVRGTRVSVRVIVEYWRIYHDVDRVHQAYPHVERSAIEQALAFYDEHRDEIDRYIAENAD